MKSWRMFRDHRFSQRHLPALLDEDLSTRQRRRLQTHARDCPECGPLLRDLQSLRRLLLGAGGGTGTDGTRADGVLRYLRTATAIDAQRPASAS